MRPQEKEKNYVELSACVIVCAARAAGRGSKAEPASSHKPIRPSLGWAGGIDGQPASIKQHQHHTICTHTDLFYTLPSSPNTHTHTHVVFLPNQHTQKFKKHTNTDKTDVRMEHNQKVGKVQLIFLHPSYLRYTILHHHTIYKYAVLVE